MKKIAFSLFALLCAGFVLPAHADELMVAATMQRCTTNEDCVLVTNSCQDNCAFVPVNKETLPTLQNQYQARCGKTMDQNPSCNMNPPLSAACINSRCTIDYAYKNNSSAGDYQSGAYAVPEAPTPSKVQGDYSKVNDRHGFTAYDLPQNEVKEKTVGTLHTTVYVPPSAPVSGGEYVPVGQAPVPQAAPPAAPAMATPVVPPAAMPANTSYATPPVAVPSAPAQIPPATATPAYIPPVPPSNVPPMTPSLPNQLPPGSVDTGVAAPAMPAVPATPTVPAVPAPTTYVAPDPLPTGPVIPSVGAPGVPVAPPGSTPIPPSDLKPVPSLVPPPGGTSEVNPEDPGAPPPPGTKIMLKGSEMETDATKSFSAKPVSEKKAAKLGSFN